MPSEYGARTVGRDVLIAPHCLHLMAVLFGAARAFWTAAVLCRFQIGSNNRRQQLGNTLVRWL